MFNRLSLVVSFMSKIWFKLFSAPSSRITSGFTIVELLVVIVVIGILATITIISYTGISQKATISSIQSDLTNFSKQLKIFQVENMVYPTTLNCAIPDSATNKCVKLSGSNVLNKYVVDNSISPQGFCIHIKNGNSNYKITSTKYNVPTVGDCEPTVTTLAPQNYDYIAAQQSSVVPSNVNLAQLEVWGAQGGRVGGYAKGTLSVTAGSTLYIYTGGMNGFNGGGGGGSCGHMEGSDGGNGGGGTDIRYGGSAVGNRVIVAGGGGGDSGLVGGVGGTGGGGALWQGSNGDSYSGNNGDGGGGGGGGYYGGLGGGTGYPGAGGNGGTSYVTGLASSQTIAGDSSMPSPGGGTEIGHAGNGFARIIYSSFLVDF